MIIRTVSPSKISVDAAAAGVTDSVVVVVVVTRGIPKYSAEKMVGRLIITCEHTQQVLILTVRNLGCGARGAPYSLSPIFSLSCSWRPLGDPGSTTALL